MADGFIADLVDHFNHAIDSNNKLIAALYERLQRVEADKVPAEWRPYTIKVLSPTTPTTRATQILRAEPRRNSAAIYNQGPDDLLVNNAYFDPDSILQQLSDPANPDTVAPAPGQMVEIALLPSGSHMSIDSIGSVWAFNLASGGAVVSIFESLYQAAKTGIPTMYGESGLLHQNYDADGKKVIA